MVIAVICRHAVAEICSECVRFFFALLPLASFCLGVVEAFENKMEPTNPNANTFEKLICPNDPLVGHSCGTLFWDTLVGHSCRTLLQDTLVGNSCGTLL